MKNTFIFLIIFILLLQFGTFTAAQEISLSGDSAKKVDDFIGKQMNSGKIPGLSVVITDGDKLIYKNSFGYADKSKKEPVNSGTLFELGSNSKAFTALGILLLQKQGFLNVKEPVKKYLPWFEVYYKKKSDSPTIDYINRNLGDFIPTSIEKADITLEQLLDHTSGIPFKTIGDIPSGDEDNALENTVRKLVGTRLDYHPGEKYRYATINYDVLGLVVQKVTGQAFEAYMSKNILQPLGLKDTYAGRSEAHGQNIAKGYKAGFGTVFEYNAPTYRGNTPAGYFITNADDISRWLMIQTGALKTTPELDALIADSHKAGNYLDSSGYSNGWRIYKGSEWSEISHSGSNPGYSSFIILKPEKKLGVAVMANIDSEYSEIIGQGVMSIVSDEGRIPELPMDKYIDLDIKCMLVIVIGMFFIIMSGYGAFKKKRIFEHRARDIVRGLGNNGLGLLVKVLPVCLYAVVLYFLPIYMFYGLSWKFMLVWAPVTLPVAIVVSAAAGSIFYFTHICSLSFKALGIKVRSISRSLHI